MFVFLLSSSLFIINNSFTISLSISDLVYSFSSSFLFILFLILISIIFFLQSTYFKIKFNFSKYRVNKKISQKQKGYSAFVEGMIAISNKDYKKAIVENRKISNYLDSDLSLSLLLKSEIYKIEKKYDDLSKVYEDMSKYKNTQTLGYRGLMEQYLRSHDYHHAFLYADKLFNINPYIEKIYDTLVNILVKTKNWQQLIAVTDKAFSKKIIDKKIYEDNKSIAYFEIAKIKQFSEQEDSLNILKKALKLKSNFPPFIKLYSEILIESKKYLVAKKYLKKAWNNNAHPEFKSSILILAQSNNINIVDLVKYIVGSSKNEESKILLVEASIIGKKWKEARSELKNLLDTKPKKEICLLMAKIEEGENSDIQKVNAWTLRSEKGVASHIWICSISNKAQNEWTSVSDGGYFNSLVWKQPFVLQQNNTLKVL